MTPPPEPELVLRGGAEVQRQIEDQLRACIACGLLRPGDQLPTMRAVAVGLAVNPAAVGRAYERLRHEGYLSNEEGSGTFVAPAPPVADRSARFEGLCVEFLAAAGGLGISPAEAVSALREFTERSCRP